MDLSQSINGLIDWFQPSPNLIENLPVGQSEGSRYCRLSIIAGLFLAVMIIITFLIRITLEGVASTTLFALLGASLICASMPFLIKYTARYHISNTIFLILGLTIIPVRILETGGFSSAVISWYLIACMLFFAVGSIRFGVIAYLLVFLELSILYFAIKHGWGNTNFIPSDAVQFWVFAIALSTGIGVIYGYEKQRIANISRLKEKNEKISSDNNILVRQKIELEKANLDRSTLLNVLCHDIANPLQVVSGSAELFKSLKDAKQKDDYIENIVKASTVIKQIIDHVRSIQAADIRVAGLQLTPVNLRKCIAQVCFVFEDKLQKKNITIVIDEDSMSALKVLAEPVSLNNFVINNVISNAIKFSEEGGRIEMSSGKKDGLICLKIKDCGIGMTAEIIKDLFATSKVSSRPGTQGEQGTGLGMKIMSSYLSGYGGHVKIESTPMGDDSRKHGTIFYLYLREA